MIVSHWLTTIISPGGESSNNLSSLRTIHFLGFMGGGDEGETKQCTLDVLNALYKEKLQRPLKPNKMINSKNKAIESHSPPPQNPQSEFITIPLP
jgi:hypothetical protein